MVSSKIPLKSNPSIEPSTRIAVAFSGGLDSTVLLHSTIAAYGNENVMAFHVNHGLQAIAHDWVLHCAKVAKDFEIEFDYRLVEWEEDLQQLSNIEAQARNARYRALSEMCQEHAVEHLLLAHHQDDQAETVLLQLLRGSGLPGLSAMPQVRDLASGVVRIWRPFLELTRAELESYALEYHLEWIEDPSNHNEQFTRNFIRQKVLPLIEKVQPQFRSNLSRSASHLSSAQRLLDQLADIDLNVMRFEQGLQMVTLLALRDEDLDRANNALRRWLSLQGLSMPSEERLNAWWRDVESLKNLDNHQLSWEHDGKILRLWRQHLMLVESLPLGQWVFRELQKNEEGFGLSDALYQQAQVAGSIGQRMRQAGDKLRLMPKAHRKVLKNLFQELGIPPWQRSAPILTLNSEILAVAGLGMNCDLCTNEGIRWVAAWESLQQNPIRH